MRPRPDDHTRLTLLNLAQPDRPWRTSRERRRCVVCERVFRGDEADVRESPHLAGGLACPKCGSGPALWVRLGNPLIDDRAWADWEAAMALSTAESWDDRNGDIAAVS